MNLDKILKEKHGTIIDVRTPEEFNAGNVKGSVNIPLHSVLKRLDEIKSLKTPLVLCCASGNRSGEAFGYLTRHGIECLNGGSWTDVNDYQLQNS